MIIFSGVRGTLDIGILGSFGSKLIVYGPKIKASCCSSVMDPTTCKPNVTRDPQLCKCDEPCPCMSTATRHSSIVAFRDECHTGTKGGRITPLLRFLEAAGAGFTFKARPSPADGSAERHLFILLQRSTHLEALEY